MSAFESAVRLMAVEAGHDVTPSTPVEVEMTGEWSGYSEYTVTNQWDAFTVRCGAFVKTYDTEEESRHWCEEKDCRHYAVGPKAALAKLFDDLAKVQVPVNG